MKVSKMLEYYELRLQEILWKYSGTQSHDKSKITYKPKHYSDQRCIDLLEDIIQDLKRLENSNI